MYSDTGIKTIVKIFFFYGEHAAGGMLSYAINKRL